MAENMLFPSKWEKFIEDYSFNDSEEVYTNNSELVPVFRVEQMVEHYFQNRWIPVSERLPEEHDSFFARFYGTKRWLPTMFRKVSDEVIVFIKYEDGSTSVKTQKTEDGKWNISSIWQAEVTHWMPLPEPPKEENR